jgi:hypothetical protein
MQLYEVSPAHIDRAWRDGAAELARACKWAANEITPDQLKMLLSRGERQLLCVREGEAIKGWVAVQVQQLPNIRILYVYGLAGKDVCTPEGGRLIREYAEGHGCSSVRGSVRASMMRMLKQRFGARPLYQTFEMECV